ncbi:MAG TPA: translocation/assembly module TamB domain-containing protein [Candidatus Krumholzibacteria bacterium]|nr:translocation/assembly module TamB domain-containing protein [Candidatus Krumholzibacteria bacterium]
MTRARRIPAVLFAGTGGLLLLALLLVCGVLFTAPGGRFVVRVLNGRDLPVRVGAFDGSLAGRFQLYGVEFRAGPIDAVLDTVRVAWRPWSIRNHHLEFNDVVVSGARMVVHESSDSTTRTAPGAARAHPDSARVASGTPWKFSAERLRVRNATVDGPANVHLHAVDITASGGPDSYQAVVTAAGSAWRFEEMSTFVRVAGNSRAAMADSLVLHALGGTTTGDAYVRWSPGIAWRARLAGDSLHVGAFASKPNDWLGAVAFRLRSTGLVHDDSLRVGVDLEALDGTLRARPLSAHGRVDIDGRHIEARDAVIRWGDARVALSGHVTETVDVTLDAVVPSLADLLPDAHGSARARGRITGDGSRVNVKLTVAGEQLGVGRREMTSLDAAVDATVFAHDYQPHGLEVRAADIKLEGGHLRVHGRVDWEHGIVWDGSVSAKDFEASRLTPARWKLDGPVSVEANSAGSYRNHRPAGTLDITSLHGTLRGQPLAGAGRVVALHDSLDITSLRLDWGTTHLEATGNAGETLDLTVNLRAPDLSLFGAALHGALALDGTARGARRRPFIDATVRGDSVRIHEYAANRVEGHVGVDFGFAAPADVDLMATGLSRGESTLDTLRVNVAGPRDGQRIALFVARDGAHVALAAHGALADSSWAGWIDRLDVLHPAVGEWRTGTRATVRLSPALVALDSLSLSSNASRLAMHGVWAPGDSAHVDVALVDFDLAPVQKFIHPGASVTGTMDGTVVARADATGRISGHAELVPGPGTVTVAGRRLDYQGHVTAQADENGVSAAVDFALNRDGAKLASVNANFAIPGFIAGRDSIGAQPVSGAMDVECRDIGPVLALVRPEVSGAAGALNAHLTPRGTAEDFRLMGNLSLEKARADLPSGLRLRDIGLSLESDGAGNIALNGAVTSGGGRVEIEARSVRSQKNWVNGTFTVKGERFQIVNQPEAQIFMSPALEMRVVETRASITGNVTVPYARIEIAEVPPSAVAQSNDVVFVEDTLTTRSRWQVDTDVRVALGDSVSFSGFGLRSRLEGELAVLDQRGQPTRGRGEIRIKDGKYRAYGTELTIDRGRLIFGGGAVDNPGLDIRAIRTTSAQNVMTESGQIVGMNVTGSLRKPEISLFSVPAMSESEILSYLVLGRPMSNQSSGDQAALASAAMLLTMQRGNELTNTLGKQFTLDEAYIESGDSYKEASFVAGKYLSPKLYVSYATGFFEHTNTFRVRYSLSNRWTVQAESGDVNSTDLLYWFELGK